MEESIYKLNDIVLIPKINRYGVITRISMSAPKYDYIYRVSPGPGRSEYDISEKDIRVLDYYYKEDHPEDW